jgi:hypothetical protein
MNQQTPLASGTQERTPVARGVADALPGEDIANWLQEVAKRPHVGASRPRSPAPREEHGPGDPGGLGTGNRIPHMRGLIAFTAVTGGFMLNYYVDVMLQIANLHAVIVFV